MPLYYNIFLAKIKKRRLASFLFFALMRAHPWGTLFCFNPLFVLVSLHTPLFQWNPCEAYQLMFIIKHKLDVVKTFLIIFNQSKLFTRDRNDGFWSGAHGGEFGFDTHLFHDVAEAI